MSVNININERIKSAGLDKNSEEILTKLYALEYGQVHAVASALNASLEGQYDSDIFSHFKNHAELESLLKNILELGAGSMLNVVNFSSKLSEECGINLSAGAQGGGQQAGGEEAVVAEKTSFQVKLTNLDGMEKINAVKYLKELLGVDLKTASGLLDPKDLKVLPKTFSKDEADEVVNKLGGFKVFAEKI